MTQSCCGHDAKACASPPTALVRMVATMLRPDAAADRTSDAPAASMCSPAVAEEAAPVPNPGDAAADGWDARPIARHPSLVTGPTSSRGCPSAPSTTPELADAALALRCCATLKPASRRPRACLRCCAKCAAGSPAASAAAGTASCKKAEHFPGLGPSAAPLRAAAGAQAADLFRDRAEARAASAAKREVSQPAASASSSGATKFAGMRVQATVPGGTKRQATGVAKPATALVGKSGPNDSVPAACQRSTCSANGPNAALSRPLQSTGAAGPWASRSAAAGWGSEGASPVDVGGVFGRRPALRKSESTP